MKFEDHSLSEEHFVFPVGPRCDRADPSLFDVVFLQEPGAAFFFSCKNDVYFLPKLRYEKVASLHLPVLVRRSLSLIRNHTDYICVQVEDSFKGSVPASRPTCITMLRLTLTIHVARHVPRVISLVSLPDSDLPVW